MTTLELLNITQEQKVKGIWIDECTFVRWHDNGVKLCELRRNEKLQPHGKCIWWKRTGEIEIIKYYHNGNEVDPHGNDCHPSINWKDFG